MIYVIRKNTTEREDIEFIKTLNAYEVYIFYLEHPFLKGVIIPIYKEPLKAHFLNGFYLADYYKGMDIMIEWAEGKTLEFLRVIDNLTIFPSFFGEAVLENPDKDRLYFSKDAT